MTRGTRLTSAWRSRMVSVDRLGSAVRRTMGPSQGSRGRVARGLRGGRRAISVILSACLMLAVVSSARSATWSVQQAPAGLGASLSGLSCTSSSLCTTVGAALAPEAARWDGTRWTPERF